MAKNIPLTQRKVAIVDDADFEQIAKYNWHFSGRYAARWGKRHFHKREKVLMHRAILKPHEGSEIDHINGNTLDNRRENLRICSHAENMHNARRRFDNTSGFKGVTWNKQHSKWQAQIQVSGSKVFIGRFNNKVEAAIAYDEKAREILGIYAKVNFDDATDSDARRLETR